jgi:sugar lactone lactonase YvrE
VRSKRTWMLSAVVSVAVLGGPAPAVAGTGAPDPQVRELASFAAPGCAGGCGSGSALGPDGALYVTDGKAGRVLRVDPDTGATTTFASGLPPSIPDVGIGGAMDVAFVRHTAYVLVTLVGPALGQPDVVDGLYRVGDDGSVTPVADIGSWSVDHPPATAFFIPSGVQYALQRVRGGFLVTDGHHNRVLHVTRRGEISQVIAFGDDVPTGIDVLHGRVFLALAGPVPHLPETGRVVTFRPGAATADLVAPGIRLAVDVEVTSHDRLWALSQGVWDLPVIPENEGMPASPNTGALMRIGDGGVSTVVGGLDRPTSMEIAGRTAFVVTLTGKVLRIDHLARR